MLALCLALALASARAADIPVGKSDRVLELGQTQLQVFLHRPEHWKGERLLIVMHGVLRNADEYRDHAIGMSVRFDALVAAPCFDAQRFPSIRYQRGGILNAAGAANAPQDWTYALIPQLIQELRSQTAKPALKAYVIGHSAGGQFVLRMSAFQETGAIRLVAANPGSALFPNLEWPFGYGFGNLPHSLANEERLKSYLAAPLTLYLGTDDDRADDYFDSSAAAFKQGMGRHQRNLACYWYAQGLASARGWPCAWRLVEAPGIGHDHQQMFDHERCAAALFGEAASKD